jgi:predicted aminopeptidase
LLVCSLLVLLGSCIQTRYVVQASLGQLELLGRARPIERVLRDPDIDARTRFLLTEVQAVLDYASRQGLKSQGNYQKYVDLDREAVVWFMTTSRPLAFEPRLWSFPIVGSFPYLGWFDYLEALKIQRRLEEDGWEVFVRRVRAYSTGGWFNDPVLSTMLSDEEDAYRSLVNVLMHELVHANVLVNDQSTFNESIASFVGDQMALEYLAHRLGPDSAELVAFREELREDRERGIALEKAYGELDALYTSQRSDQEKRRRKRGILRRIESDLDLDITLNNAVMIGFKTYNAGLDEFAELYRLCDSSFPRFLEVVGSLESADFASEQQEDIAPVIERLIGGGCRGGSRSARK